MKTQNLPFRNKLTKATTQTPEQQQMMKLISQALQKGEGPLADLFGKFNEGEFQKGVATPALEHFKNTILPQIGAKFAGGHGGSQYANAMTKGATDLQSTLAHLMYQAQQQQAQNRQGGINSFLGTKGFENIVTEAPKESTLLQQLLPVAGAAAGSFLGPAGTAAGTAFGNAASQYFTQKAGA